MSFNQYMPVSTKNVPVHTGMYKDYQKLSDDTVLWLLTVGNDTVCVQDMYMVVLEN